MDPAGIGDRISGEIQIFQVGESLQIDQVGIDKFSAVEPKPLHFGKRIQFGKQRIVEPLVETGKVDAEYVVKPIPGQAISQNVVEPRFVGTRVDKIDTPDLFDLFDLFDERVTTHTRRKECQPHADQRDDDEHRAQAVLVPAVTSSRRR